MKIKTIDVNAREWFDKINGNSYFSAQVSVNFGMKNAKVFYLPFQYGYGDHYRNMAFEQLQRIRFITDIEKNESYWRYCDRKKIILRLNKNENCLKRDVITWGGE